jgi:hypothetical protein
MRPELAVMVEGTRQHAILTAGTTIRINHQHFSHDSSPLLIKGSYLFFENHPKPDDTTSFTKCAVRF